MEDGRHEMGDVSTAKFRLSSLGLALRNKAPHDGLCHAIEFAHDMNRKFYASLTDAVQKGKASPAGLLGGVELFEYLLNPENKKLATDFTQFMSAIIEGFVGSL